MNFSRDQVNIQILSTLQSRVKFTYENVPWGCSFLCGVFYSAVSDLNRAVWNNTMTEELERIWQEAVIA
jgi:hypothetical protein